MKSLRERQAITRLPSDMDSVERVLHDVLLRLYGRTPTDLELQAARDRLGRPMDAAKFLAYLAKTKAFQDNVAVRTKSRPGHYYSPVVDPDQVADYVAASRAMDETGLAGIELPLEAMAEFWQSSAALIAAVPFQETPDGSNRYCFRGGPYNDGDAVVLWTMLGHYRPRKVIEIGSGYSSALMLDAADHQQISDFHLTCIEPNPGRLKSVLREEDFSRIAFHHRAVQDVPLEIFDELERNDILFIDSSHVLKTGSDVHFELFRILPRLRPGVIIHFHDCRFPMEYSDRQIFVKNYSWNEAYAVRCLLMFSTRFKVLFYGSLFARRYPALAAMSTPFRRNPGSALWIVVEGS